MEFESQETVTGRVRGSNEWIKYQAILRFEVCARKLDRRIARLRRALRQHPDGLTRTEVSKVFDKNLKAEQLDLVLNRAGVVEGVRQSESGRGRSATVFKLATDEG